MITAYLVLTRRWDVLGRADAAEFIGSAALAAFEFCGELAIVGTFLL